MASILDRLLTFTISDDYGFFSTIASTVLAHFSSKAVNDWDAHLAEAKGSLGPLKEEHRDWKRRAKLRKIIGLREAIADHRGDVDVFISLETDQPEALRDTIAIAKRLCGVAIRKRSTGFAGAAGRA